MPNFAAIAESAIASFLGGLLLVSIAPLWLSWLKNLWSRDKMWRYLSTYIPPVVAAVTALVSFWLTRSIQP